MTSIWLISSLQPKRPWRKYLSPSRDPALLTYSPFFHLLPLQPVHHPVHSAPSTPLSEGSMAHRHRNRQPWQVELAGSAAMHDTPCDRGMPTLWNQNEHCALTPSLFRVHGLLHSFQWSLSAFDTCSQSHCFTATCNFSGFSLFEAGKDIFHVAKRWIEALLHGCCRVRNSILRSIPLVETTHALQCHVLHKQVVTSVQWLLSLTASGL